MASSTATWTYSQPMPRTRCPTVAGDPMADAADPAEFLDVQVHQVRRAASTRSGWTGTAGSRARSRARPQPLQPPGDGGPAELQRLGDLGAGPALPAQPARSSATSRGGQRVGAVVRPAGPVDQAGQPGGLVAAHPLTHGPFADPDGLGDVPGRIRRPAGPAGRGPLDCGAWSWHSGGCSSGPPSWGGWRVVATTSLPDEARVNNLLRLHRPARSYPNSRVSLGSSGSSRSPVCLNPMPS